MSDAGRRRSVVVNGPAGATTIYLPARGELTIGRAEDCDVCVDDPKLSRKHLTLRIGDDVSVVDHGSTNGTFVRNERLVAGTPHDVVDGDTVTFGNTTLKVRSEVRANAVREATTTAESFATVRSQVVSVGAIAKLEKIIARVAAGQINVLLLGETGVAKEVLARILHDRSPRAAGPLVTINCAAIAEGVMESELFGHEKGAFTGATQARIGLLESARGGSVFLDEIGEMPLLLQAKLLRVIEEREVLPVGAVKPRPIDVRFLAATNRSLEREVEEGRFRGDLYFRLHGIALTLPPLRQRVDEIESLARAFVNESCAQLRSAAMTITPEALGALRSYAWPGNIRELRQVMERAVVLSSGGSIGTEHLPRETVLSAPSLRVSAAPKVAEEPASSEGDERERIVAALEKCGGNQSKAAQLLGIARRTLINRIERYGLPRPRKEDESAD